VAEWLGVEEEDVVRLDMIVQIAKTKMATMADFFVLPGHVRPFPEAASGISYRTEDLLVSVVWNSI
jgi:hypothetical protein